ncbi:MAG: hypothetical protein WB821_05075 [Burkholderiaceae bacterium]
MLSRLKANPWHNTQPALEPLSNQERQDQKALASLVPRKFENLEVWLLVFCGLYGLLVTAVVTHSSTITFLACTALLAMAVWRYYRPARTQKQWTLGAFIALAIVVSIYADPSSRGSVGPYLYLLLLMAVAYPLLMDSTFAVVYTVCVLMLYFFSGQHRLGEVSKELFLLRGVLLLGLCGLSARFGIVMRQVEHSIERLRHDIASLAYNEHGLARYGSRLLTQCHQAAKPCTMVLLCMPQDWFSPLHMGGNSSDYSARESPKVQTQALRDMAHSLSGALPGDALVARSQQGDWILLVPGMNRLAVITKLEKAFGRPIQLQFGPRSEEMFVALTPCAVEATGSDDRIDKMLASAYDIWQRGVRTGAVHANG